MFPTFAEKAECATTHDTSFSFYPCKVFPFSSSETSSIMAFTTAVCAASFPAQNTQ